MTGKLDIDSLRTLCAIRAHGGVTRAASEMGLSQSAVSHKVKRLEKTLGCALLARRPGAPLLTDAGERLHDYAQRMSNLHDEALADLGKKALNGAIRLGMTEDTTTSDLSKVLGRFARLHPAVRVHIRSSQSLNVQTWLKQGELDLALMQVFTKDVQDGDRILFEDTLNWVKSPDLPLDPKNPIPFLSFDQNCFYRQWGFSDGLRTGYSFEKVLECPSASGIQSGVRAGLGVALLNGMHVTQDMEIIEDLFPPPPDLTFIARTYPKSRTAPVKALLSEITREYRSATV
ncbi:MAG: LysR family transcriptional regulator [Pseudomonadota bacterium]